MAIHAQDTDDEVEDDVSEEPSEDEAPAPNSMVNYQSLSSTDTRASRARVGRLLGVDPGGLADPTRESMAGAVLDRSVNASDEIHEAENEEVPQESNEDPQRLKAQLDADDITEETRLVIAQFDAAKTTRAEAVIFLRSAFPQLPKSHIIGILGRARGNIPDAWKDCGFAVAFEPGHVADTTEGPTHANYPIFPFEEAWKDHRSSLWRE